MARILAFLRPRRAPKTSAAMVAAPEPPAILPPILPAAPHPLNGRRG